MRVADDLDARDLVVREREAKDAEESSSGGDNHSDVSFYQNWTGKLGTAGSFDSFFGPSCGTTAFSRDAWRRGGIVYADNDVGVENGDECVEVRGSQSFQKFVDDFALLREFGTRCRRRALDSAACAAC
jgi:hypothetical protein